MKGIWKYNEFHDIPTGSRFTLDEGDTPVFSITIDGIKVIVKDENQNPNGSFKDRCAAYQISKHTSDGNLNFVISSSGNAALSSASFCKLAKAKLDIFVSRNLAKNKLNAIKKHVSDDIVLHTSDRPKSNAIQYAKKHNKLNLRASTDETAPIGYKSISYELSNQYPKIKSIFIPCSSGTSALGINAGFIERNLEVSIYICQTQRVHPISRNFVKDVHKASTSLADAIVDKVAHRKKSVIDMIQRSGGTGLIITDDELLKAQAFLQSSGKDATYNSLLSLAGIMQARDRGLNIEGSVALFSGT